MVLDGLLTPTECEELRQRMAVMVEEMDVPEHCRTTFSTYQEEQIQTQVTLQGSSSLSRSPGFPSTNGHWNDSFPMKLEECRNILFNFSLV